MPRSFEEEIIAAIATPPGKGGVGVIRISANNIQPVIAGILKRTPEPRHASFESFLDGNGETIDQGIALYFPAPASYTGEHVLELQGHGGPAVMDLLLNRLIALGARLARPGEFTERAFLNGKLDLVQAEAVADLIESSTAQAARSALRSMQGAFSERVSELADQLTELRLYLEAAIDFAEEEIDFLSDGSVERRLDALLLEFESIRRCARQGSLLREGMSVVITGRPNVGKSSLLNRLSGRQAAIVTDVEGTTRDVLREPIQIDGVPIHIIDTAGLRQSNDPIEQEGVRRAYGEIENADRILLVIDDNCEQNDGALVDSFPDNIGVTTIFNKIDLSGKPPSIQRVRNSEEISLSVKTGQGFEYLLTHLKQCMGYESGSDDVFSARRRHLDCLQKAHLYIIDGREQLKLSKAGELLAEDLRSAQRILGEITGEVTPDDLLGRIFSSFCIGK